MTPPGPPRRPSPLSMPAAADLYNDIALGDAAGDVPGRLRRLFPGLAACTCAAAAAAWLSDHYAFPVILLGLLVGLALNFIADDERTRAGLDFASSHFLRVGIVILGMQVTAAQIFQLGAAPFTALLLIMAVTIGAGLAAARIAGQSPAAGLLAGGATAICGASAALALYDVIGRKRLPEAQFTLTLVGISLASAVAMSLYPVLAAKLGLTDKQAGFLIGASIHDVAQAIGGGYAFSNAAGADATIVKLARVALLAPVVAGVGLLLPLGREASGAPKRKLAMPWFVPAFLGVVALNSLLPVPVIVAHFALALSKALLLLAITATAMRTRLELLVSMSWRAGMPVAAASVASFLIALACAVLVA